MDFRTNKNTPISQESITSRNYGVYDNLVFSYKEPLSDKQIQWITSQLQQQERLQSAFDDYLKEKLEKQIEPDIDKAIEETIGNELEKAFRGR